jgi:SRSO17 transposase
VAFATKPQLGQVLLQRALDAGVAFGWVTGDSVYGGDRRLRVWLEEHAIRHVMAVKRTEPLLAMTDRGPGQVPAEQLLACVPAAHWLRLSAGQGAKGKRLYDWTRVPLWRLGWPANVGFWLLARRSTSDPDELAYYVCFAPTDTSLATLVQVAGRRWRVEEAFEQAKGEVGLDHYQVRQYTAWYRHITLAMTAHAFLAVTRAGLDDPLLGSGGCRGDRAGRAHHADRPRVAPAAARPRVDTAARPRVHAWLVGLATPPPSHRSPPPLPATTQQTATVGLGRE